MELLYPYNGDKMLSFVVINGKIIEISEFFISETGYNKQDFISKTVEEAFKILRSNVDINNVDNKKYYYIFTKSLEFIKVKVHLIKQPLKKYDLIIFTEINDENIKNSINFLEQLYSNDVVAAAVYSVSDLILVRSNKRYLINNSKFKMKEDSYGKSIYDVVVDFSGSTKEKSLMEVLNTGKPIHLSQCKFLNSKNYTSYWDVTTTPIFFNGEMEYIIETSVDVTEKVKDKRLIKEQNNLINQGNELIEAVFQNVPLGIGLIDNKGNWLKQNKLLRKMFKLDALSGSAESIFKKGCCFGEDGNKLTYEKIPSIRVSKGEKFYRQLIVVKSGNDIMHLRASGKPIYNSDGEFQMGIICLWDVTKTVKYNELVLKEKDTLLSDAVTRNFELKKTLKEQEEFFSNISHEFKTPLNVIFASLQLMDLYTDETSVHFNPSVSNKYTKVMKQNCYRLLRMIDNLIDISEINSGNYDITITENDIVELVEGISLSVIDYAKRKGVSLIFDTNVEEKIIGCSPDFIERILLNLLSNALKFTSQDGSIIVTLTDLGEKFSISVKDTGIGILEEHMGKIFERFSQVDKSFTRNNEGSGMGLAVVKSLVNLYGGTISVISTLGKGSEFKVTLPVKYYNSADGINRNLEEKSKIDKINIEFSDIYC